MRRGQDRFGDSFIYSIVSLSIISIAVLFLVLTQSRGGIVALCVALVVEILVLGGNKCRWTIFTCALTVIVAFNSPTVSARMAAIAHPGNDFSASSRLETWKSTSALIHDFPLTGCGRGNFREFYLSRYQSINSTWDYWHPLNDFLYPESRYGLIATILLGAFIFCIVVLLAC